MMLVRQIAAILALPTVMAILIPLWIARRDGIVFAVPRDLAGAAAVVAGIALLAVGLTLFSASIFHFWTRGRGTLAPWDPPRHFVVEGPYLFVRNPMISGVIFVLAAEACILRAWPLAEWAALFTAINLVYIPLLEEPQLEARFGEPYREYTRTVPRFLPRLRS